MPHAAVPIPTDPTTAEDLASENIKSAEPTRGQAAFAISKVRLGSPALLPCAVQSLHELHGHAVVCCRL